MKSAKTRTKRLISLLATLKRQVSLLKEQAGERQRAEDGMKKVVKEWETTFDSITDMVSIHGSDFRLQRVNKKSAEVFGMKAGDLIGRYCYDVFHKAGEPPKDCPYKKLKATGEIARYEYFETSLGINLEVIVSPLLNEERKVIGCVHVVRDISEWKKMQENMVITERMASVGELASGVAHEISNPLTSVIGYLELLLGENVPANIKEDIAIAHHEALRAAEVVSNLLNFVRKHVPAKKPVNVNGVIAMVLGLRAYEQKVHNIRVKTGFDGNLPMVVADIFQLQQVFLNIVINAEYFMIKAHGGGVMNITTEKAGDVVRVSFTDDGPGILEENMERIFAPFFTTKEDGKGTGLGLSICRGVIAELGGRIYAANGQGGGAKIIVELPAINDKREALNDETWHEREKDFDSRR